MSELYSYAMMEDLKVAMARAEKAEEENEHLKAVRANFTQQIVRLTTLIRNVERSEGEPPGICPWCHFYVIDKQHSTECPAFTPEGDVKWLAPPEP